MKKYIISALTSNKSGVLTRISGLFTRRGYNIDSLCACATEDPTLSRMTIVLEGDDYILGQVTKQLDKLIDVKKILRVDTESAIYRELLLVKVNAPPEKRSAIMEICQIFRAKIDDLYHTSMVIEVTGESGKIDGFIDLIKEFGILEMARTGITAIMRGDKCIKDIEDFKD